MRNLESHLENVTTNERHSRREQCGVEILEREIVTRIRISEEGDIPAPSLPRLVVTDTINATRDFISKRRSEFRELDAFLKTVAPQLLRSR